MRFTRCRRSAARWTPLVAAGLIAAALLAGPLSTPSAVAASCFAVGDNVVCMDHPDFIPVPPIMPPVMQPVISDGIGDADDAIVIEDNGGYERDQG
ncbi:MAG: hypothetical protein U0031_13575 [Thermomicrobiales bacterium]